MIRCRALAIAVGCSALLGCATSGEPDGASVPVCAPIAELEPLPAEGACDENELTRYQGMLAETKLEKDHRAHVRVSFDEASRVSDVCVESEVGGVLWQARRVIADRLDAIRGVPPGPACLAGKRLDFNRYDAKFAEIEYARTLCERQVGRRTGALRECLQFQSDWIAIDAPGSTRPAIFVKPEVVDPPGPAVVETVNRCSRTEREVRFEDMADCILSDGYEVLMPPPR
jgi:hypothetical protein